ncbi:hypothetical protein PIB30_101780, partial [Stylosanthes scabra]|nr:hypothetical protein [Stylosanthes scabra]
MYYPPVNNPLPEGEDEDIAAEEAAAAQAGRVYLRWDRAGIEYGRAPQRFHGYTTITTSGMSLSLVTLRSTRSNFGGTVGGAFSDSRGVTSSRFMSLGSKELPRGSESFFHEIRKKGAPHGWIPADIFDRLVEFWCQEDFKRLQRTNTKNRSSETGGSM